MVPQRVTGTTSPDSLSSKIISSGGDRRKAATASNQISTRCSIGSCWRTRDTITLPPPMIRRALEFEVLGEKHQILLGGKSLDNLGVRNPSAPAGDDVLRLMPRRSKRSIEVERKVFVEEDLQDSSLTAGGA